MTRRADIVIVRLPQSDGTPGKVRPAVIVQCDRLNAKLQSTLAAVITSNTRHAGKEPTQLLIDPSTPDGASSGLSYVSVVKCENISTIRQVDIVDTIGRLSDPPIRRLAACLSAALELPDR